MDSLTPVHHGNNQFFCLVQIKNNIFPNLLKSTLRSCMKEIHVSCIPLLPEEKDYLKSAVPNLNGAFGLLSESDLKMLVRLKEHKEQKSMQHLAEK